MDFVMLYGAVGGLALAAVALIVECAGRAGPKKQAPADNVIRIKWELKR